MGRDMTFEEMPAKTPTVVSGHDHMRMQARLAMLHAEIVKCPVITSCSRATASRLSRHRPFRWSPISL